MASSDPSPRRERIDWQTAEWVFVTLPSCPSCGGLDYHSVRSEATGDGGSTIKAICKECSEPFKIARELPSYGNR